MTWDGRSSDSGPIVVGSGGTAPAYGSGMSAISDYYYCWFEKVGSRVDVHIAVTKGAASALAFTLPPGFRPAAAVVAALGTGAAAQPGQAFAVAPDGSVTFVDSALVSDNYFGSITFGAAS